MSGDGDRGSDERRTMSGERDRGSDAQGVSNERGAMSGDSEGLGGEGDGVVTASGVVFIAMARAEVADIEAEATVKAVATTKAETANAMAVAMMATEEATSDD